MDALLESLRHGTAELIGALVAGCLVVVLAATLPEAQRRLVRGPLALLGLYLVVALVRWLAAPEEGWRRALDLAALALLLLSLARAGVLLGVEVVLGRRRLPKIIRDIVQTVVYAGVAVFVLRALGMDPGSLLTTSALLTAVIGLSLQETLGNLFAGLAIQMQRPFEVGDWIQFDPDIKLIGRVLEINWRATKLLTLDEVEVIVPNGALAKTPIRNYTKPHSLSRRSVYVHAGYDAPPNTVHAAILAALREVPGVVETPAPSVVTNAFGESGVEYWVRFYTHEFHKRDIVDGAVRDRIWYALRRESITIPYPQRIVQLHEISEAVRTADAERSIDERDRALRNVSFFDRLPEGDHKKLAAMTTRRGYASGEVIVSEGDLVNDLFIVERGEVLVMLDRPGEEHDVELERLGPGKFFGEIEFITGARRFATVKAVTACQLLVVKHEALRDILSRSPEVAEQITLVLAERVEKLEGYAAAIPADGAIDSEARRSHLLTRIRRFFSL
jgi:small-conductance mechanosensitive channel/CRP-like cAMP-binding protein